MNRTRASRIKVFRALLWEQWRQTRIILAVPVAFAVLIALFVFLIELLHPGFAGDSAEGWMVLDGACMAIAFVLVPFSHCDKNNLQAGLPPQTLALPVSTRTLGTMYLGYRMLALAATSFIVALLAGLIGMTEFEYLIEIPLVAGFAALIACLVYAYIQAVLWTAGALHLFLAAALIVGLAPVVGLTYQFVARILTGAIGHPLPATFAVVCLYVLAFTAIAYLGLSWGRQGARPDLEDTVRRCRPTRTSLKEAVRRRLRVPEHFSSPQEAQCWFEGRRKGRIFLISTLGFMLFFWCFFPFGLAAPRATAYRLETYLLVCWLSLNTSAFLTGMLTMTLDYRDHATGLTTFTMTRSLSTGTIARARLRMAARSVANTYLLLFAGFLLWFVLAWLADEHVIVDILRAAGFPPQLETVGYREDTFGVHRVIARPRLMTEIVLPGFFLLLAVLGHATLMWAVISFFGPLLLTLLTVYGGGILLLIALTAAGIQANEGSAIMAFALLLLAPTVLGIQVLWARRVGKRRGLKPPQTQWRRRFLLAALCIALLAFTYVTVGNELAQAGRWRVAGLLTGWTITALACLAPVVGMPVWLHWLRHR